MLLGANTPWSSTQSREPPPLVFELPPALLTGRCALQHIRGNLFRGFEVAAIQRIAGQLLVALRTLAAESIVHCDLKPENILLNAPNQLAVTVRPTGAQHFACASDAQCLCHTAK